MIENEVKFKNINCMKHGFKIDLRFISSSCLDNKSWIISLFPNSIAVYNDVFWIYEKISLKI